MKFRSLLLCSGMLAGGSLPVCSADFLQDIKPILESACTSCHGPTQQKGGLRLDTRAAALQGGDGGPSLVPGNPEKSSLYTLTILPPGHDDIMPPKGDPLTRHQTDLLKDWIQRGADWPASATLGVVRRMEFTRDVQPILEQNCVSCHREGNRKGGLDLSSREAAFSTGDSGPSIVPHKPDASTLYTTTILPSDHEDLMPPKDRERLTPEESEVLRLWILQGALWPESARLISRKKVKEDDPEAIMAVVKEIHAYLQENLKVTTEKEMKPYTAFIPGTQVSFEMLPIPSGEFVMGSPPGEKGRKEDEGPQHRVKIEPFWMGKFEVTWDEFELFMYPEHEKRIMEQLNQSADPKAAIADAVSRPTKPYVEMSFGMGKDGYPAISMTHHAASTYCKWLSARTGHYYRLPTEAEWEYACRAGTVTAYSFGDDPNALDAHAWHEANSDWKYQKVGRKKPNPWGLHDMHGNVAEWVLDEYRPDFYQQLAGQVAENPLALATKAYPHVARGGSWDDPPELLRSAARRASHPSWKKQDPQLPKSIWYLTDAQFLGFRVVRPLKVPPPEELSKYWTGNPREE